MLKLKTRMMSIKTCILFEYNPEFWILIHENI